MELISAIATAAGRGGVAIVRVSGENALALAQKMFSHRGEWEPNRMYAGEIDGGTFKDYGLCVWFRAPRSFTGEDIVEFHCHGGAEIARGILSQTVKLGARPAERGEFTRRAFLNGKLSLSAAEGMADMINAESQARVRAGYLLYGETLTKEANRLAALIKECLAEVDADLDYPEEDLTVSSRKETAVRLHAVIDDLNALLAQYRTGRKIGAGVNVALCGRPNAGKSTLLNALLGYERAIVSPHAGTTRDTVEGTLEINGVLFRLVDTAGIRTSSDETEEEGVRRAEQAVQAADVIVWLKEEETPPVAFPSGTPVIAVNAKCDVKRTTGCEFSVSAVTGEGLDRLKTLLYERGFGGTGEGVFLMEQRHFDALTHAKTKAENALAAVEKGAPAELYAEELFSCLQELGLIGGETATEDIVNEIFSKFCVGK